MNKIIGITLIVAVLGIASFSMASEDSRFGYVNLQEALVISDAGKEAKELFKVEVERIQKDLDKQQNEIKNLKDELDKKSLLLSEETRAKKEMEYQDKLKKFQRFYQDSQDELKGKDSQLTKGIVIDLRKIISKLGQEKGYMMIFEKNESSILYAPKENDLTAEVVKRFNEGRK